MYIYFSPKNIENDAFRASKLLPQPNLERIYELVRHVNRLFCPFCLFSFFRKINAYLSSWRVLNGVIQLLLPRKHVKMQIMTTSAEWFNLGTSHFRRTMFAEAAFCFQQALRFDARQAEAHLGLGNARFQQGQFAAAAESYRQALTLDPLHAHTRVNLGNALMSLGMFTEATASYQEALRIDPRHAHAYYNFGKALLSRSFFAEAGSCFRQALQLDPSNANAYSNLGHVLNELQQYTDAIACFRQALAISPGRADVYIYLAQAHWNLGQTEEAIACYRQALELNPQFPYAHYSLGNALGETGRLSEAVPCYQQELERHPDHLDSLGNLATAFMRLGFLDEAQRYNDKILQRSPNQSGARFRGALLHLLQGNLLAGWADHEQRWSVPGAPPPRVQGPRWDGSASADKTILVFHEQGFGDTIQFLRYLPLVKERCGTVIFECEPTLKELLAGIPGVDRFVPAGGPYPPFDVATPLLSLPGIFQTTIDTVPAKVPYLFADPELISNWRKVLGPKTGFHIGINWQGNPRFGDDRYRSIPLTCFKPLARLPGVTLVSLQQGPGADQLPEFQKQFSVIDLNRRLKTFNDTAAVMMNLDLIVSSCTSVPHLAGALGLPVWTALQLVPDWRWLLGREDSPWYPTMRLFRQSKFGDWNGVFERMAQEIQKLLA